MPCFKDVPLIKMADKPPLRIPGHAERVPTPVSSPTENKEFQAPHKLSEEQARELDQECYERFIKVNAKHITDGQVSGSRSLFVLILGHDLIMLRIYGTCTFAVYNIYWACFLLLDKTLEKWCMQCQNITFLIYRLKQNCKVLYYGVVRAWCFWGTCSDLKRAVDIYSVSVFIACT